MTDTKAARPAELTEPVELADDDLDLIAAGANSAAGAASGAAAGLIAVSAAVAVNDVDVLSHNNTNVTAVVG